MGIPLSESKNYIPKNNVLISIKVLKKIKKGEEERLELMGHSAYKLWRRMCDFLWG